MRCLQSALVTDFVYSDSPHCVCSALPIGQPSIDSIEAIRANIPRKDPQKSISKSELREANASSRYKSSANASAPMFGIYIECIQLSIVRRFS